MDREAEALVDIMQPVLELSIILASQYANACGRSTVLIQDFERSIKYSAMHSVGKHIGSILPELEEEEGDEDGDEEDGEEWEPEFVDVPEEDFTPYTGEDDTFKAINRALDDWQTWVPQNPAETLLKKAIDSNEDLIP